MALYPCRLSATLPCVPISSTELIETYGRAVLAGNAALFVGAGLSQAAGYPGWDGLLEPMRQRCDIPEHDDLPLVAEYIANDPAHGGIPALHAHILAQMTTTETDLTVNHNQIKNLAIKEIWTTNYDRLLEMALPEAAVVINDDTIDRIASNRSAIIKMHGSVGADNQWEQRPVITRTDYERYELINPRLWTVLRSSYMSRQFLFLGFSFTDANIEILLRLARTLGTAASDRHIAVMKSPDADRPMEEHRIHTLRVADLETSGIKVCSVRSFSEIPLILTLLAIRTRPPRLFISGSAGPGCSSPATDAQALAPWCTPLAAALVDRATWTVLSLGGLPAWLITRDVGRARRAEGTYDPTKLEIHFRDKDTPPEAPSERVGTSIYTALARKPLIQQLLMNCRALLAIGGGERTAEEIATADERLVGIVPIAAAGGAARDYWEAHRENPRLGARPVDPQTWQRLNDPNPLTVVRAAKQLLDQAMYAPSAR